MGPAERPNGFTIRSVEDNGMQILKYALANALSIFAALFVLAKPLAAEPRSVRDVVYDYAVTSYCGVLSPQVEAGFRIELSDLTARDGLNDEEAKAQRIAGWVAADKEWSNRGLGGFRGWCQDEGLEAARRFQSIYERGAQNSN
jgi:hypothetical protein